MSEIINLKNKIDDILKKKIKEFQLKNIAIDIVKNNKNEYYLILEKEKYLASLIIAEPIPQTIDTVYELATSNFEKYQ